MGENLATLGAEGVGEVEDRGDAALLGEMREFDRHFADVSAVHLKEGRAASLCCECSLHVGEPMPQVAGVEWGLRAKAGNAAAEAVLAVGPDLCADRRSDAENDVASFGNLARCGRELLRRDVLAVEVSGTSYEWQTLAAVVV